MTYAIGLLIVIIFIILLYVTLSPALLQVKDMSIERGQDRIYSDINSAIESLPAGTVKTNLQNSFATQNNATTTNSTIMTFFIQYWWIFIILVSSFGFMIFAKRNADATGGGAY